MTQEEKHKLEKTYREEKSRLMGFIRRRIPDREEAEDLLQDVFLRLILNSTGLQTIENMTAWIYSVTRNRIIDSFRKKKTQSLEDLSFTKNDGEDVLSLQDILPALGNSAEDEMLSELIWNKIQGALQEMPEEQSEVFILHEFENMPIKEISIKKQLNQNTILARKRYAVLYLRKQLQSLYNQINE
jgi:RNA polymerase sigma factor (sigma-70 family)